MAERRGGWLGALAALLALLAAGGCGGYRLEGKVVEVGWSDVSLVDPNDAALASPKVIPGAAVRLIRDPDTPRRALVAQTRSRGDGSVELEVSAFGAGWMEETWLVEVEREGYETVEVTLRLPASGKSKRLLISMRRGRSVPSARPADPMADLERFR